MNEYMEMVVVVVVACVCVGEILCVKGCFSYVFSFIRVFEKENAKLKCTK